MADDFVTSVCRGLSGYEGARRRLEATYPDLEESFAAIQEALWWVIAVQDVVDRSGIAGYRDSLATADGVVVNGLRWARNLGGHELVHPSEHHTGGLSFPASFPAAFASPSLRFLRVSEMPADDGRQKDQRRDFVSAVANGEVRDVFDAASRWMRQWVASGSSF